MQHFTVTISLTYPVRREGKAYACSLFGCCLGLERLDLSFNDINQLQALSPLVNLLTLDVSANRIASLNGMQALDKLEKLNAAGNLLGSAEVIKPVSSLPHLRSLRLHDSLKELSNPFYMRQSYKTELLKLLPNLRELDGEVVKGPGSEVFKLMADMERELGHNSANQECPDPIPSHSLAVPAEMFTVKPRELSNGDKLIEEEYNKSVELCAALSERSTKLIAQAEKKLKAQEKV
ncbi:LRRC61 [Bugula neritina]|uniref:LRRC61 n=1 Tax=Bugula neritina TaxID=10212 RepID=A0A7J7KDW1_BUGNE|nr:LRRC61 [Bugula neritina]